MQDTITCFHCGGNMTRRALSLSDNYLCDCGAEVDYFSGAQIRDNVEPDSIPEVP